MLISNTGHGRTAERGRLFQVETLPKVRWWACEVYQSLKLCCLYTLASKGSLVSAYPDRSNFQHLLFHQVLLAKAWGIYGLRDRKPWRI